MNYKPEIPNFSKHRYPLDLTPALLFPSLQNFDDVKPTLSLLGRIISLGCFENTDLPTYRPIDLSSRRFPNIHISNIYPSGFTPSSNIFNTDPNHANHHIEHSAYKNSTSSYITTSCPSQTQDFSLCSPIPSNFPFALSIFFCRCFIRRLGILPNPANDLTSNFSTNPPNLSTYPPTTSAATRLIKWPSPFETGDPANAPTSLDPDASP